jgi:adenosylcobinamide kinase / adenosylcobinamide-phosphate guanylyltransferase
MQVRIQGSGGVRGWPEAGCRCASCQRARAGGTGRAAFSVFVDGSLRLADWAEGAAGSARELAGYQVRRLSGGWEVTAPDGGRLLCADGQGAAPAVPPGARPYDVALLDLLEDPASLGRLRGQGVVTSATVVAVAFADHRVVSERELRRRGHIWGVAVPRDGDTFRAPAPVARRADVTRASDAAPGGAPAPGGPLAAGGRPVPYRVLVLGGARSGKSAEAEMRVAAEPAVTYIATAPPPFPATPPGGDAEWAARIAVHRSRRPSWWRTLETTDLPGALRQARGAVLVDSVTAWLAAVMDECGAWDGAVASASRLGQRVAELIQVWRQAGAYMIAVSDETGLGIVPETPSGRMFRDELGRLNQVLAAESDELVLVAAGRAMTVGD